MAMHVRVDGTEVHIPTTPDERIAAFRRIVERKAYAKIDGCTVDLFSASAVVAVYDALNPANRELFASKPAPVMAEIAFQLLK